MKILNVNMSIDPVNGGGTAERTVQMSKALAAAGNECSLITLDMGVNAERLKALTDVNVIRIPCLLKRFYVPYPQLSVLYRAVQNSDIIHIMGHWTMINVLIYWMAVWQGKKYVVCPAGELTLYGRSLFFKRVFKWLVGKRMIQRAAACIAVTHDEVAQFKRYGVDDEKIVVIPNGIDELDYTDSDESIFRRNSSLLDHPYILYVGRLNPIKGTDLLVQAFIEAGNMLGNHHLVIAGPDQGLREILTSMVEKAGIKDKVHFLGYLGGVDKSRAYHGANLLVIPSRHEAMSIVVLEAGICGTPVLLTDQCGFNEVEKIGGGLVVTADVKSLTQGMVALLGNTDHLPCMGAKLKQFVLEKYTWSTMADRYRSLYANILHSSK
ncbi:MAG: glycosyltransferase [Negativicutes bacterium]